MTQEMKCRPDWVIGSIAGDLRADGILVDINDIDETKAYLAAAALLQAFGVEPMVDQDDQSAAAKILRELQLEAAVRTTTRKRRQL